MWQEQGLQSLACRKYNAKPQSCGFYLIKQQLLVHILSQLLYQ